MPLKLVPGRHGGRYFYLRGTIRGRRVDESTGTSDRAAAEDILVKRSAELLQQSIHGDRAVRTFPEAALSYMDAGGDPTHLAPLLKHFGKTKLGAIGQAEIEAAAKKLKPGVSAATLNRTIYTPVAAVLHHAARKKWCDKPVIARPAQPKGRIRWVTYEEADRLVAAASDNIRPLVIFLFATGARLSEALYLNWRDVDLSRGQVVFLDTKNGEDRGVPLHPRAVAALANLPHRTGAVFRRHYGGERWNGTIRPVGEPYADRNGKGGGQIKTAWKKMLERARLADFTPHDCRHTWATWHYAENRDLRALMELGGWKTPAMVMRYAHVNTSHLAASVGRIWGASGAEVGESPLQVVTNPLPRKA
jgi:integrase